MLTPGLWNYLFFPRKTILFETLRGLKLGSMLDLVLGGVLEASWSDLGRFFGGQDGAKLAQDGGKTAQDGAKTAQDGAQDAPKTAQDGPKMRPRQHQDGE